MLKHVGVMVAFLAMGCKGEDATKSKDKDSVEDEDSPKSKKKDKKDKKSDEDDKPKGKDAEKLDPALPKQKVYPKIPEAKPIESPKVASVGAGYKTTAKIPGTYKPDAANNDKTATFRSGKLMLAVGYTFTALDAKTLSAQMKSCIDSDSCKAGRAYGVDGVLGTLEISDTYIRWEGYSELEGTAGKSHFVSFHFPAGTREANEQVFYDVLATVKIERK